MMRIQDPPRETKEEEVGTTLDRIAREGSRRMLIEALDEEVADYIERRIEGNKTRRVMRSWLETDVLKLAR